VPMKGHLFVQPIGFLLALAVAGCAADSTTVENMMVVPTYFDTLDCRDLVIQYQTASKRLEELTLLKAKAAGETGGAIASTLAYDTDYAKARATKKYSEGAANRKGCDLTKKPDSTPAQTKPRPGRLDWATPGR
jgi:hypothetical protein